MDETRTTTKHRLKIQVGSKFTCPYEWCLVDYVYWRSNLSGGQYTCRLSNIQKHTPIKRIETIITTLTRLVNHNIGFTKVPFGKPQMRKRGKDRSEEVEKQSYQYVFDANIFNDWLKSASAAPIRKRIDPYPKADSKPILKRIDTYPKTDSKRIKEETKEGDKRTKNGPDSSSERLSLWEGFWNETSSSLFPSIQPSGSDSSISSPLSSSIASGNVMTLDDVFPDLSPSIQSAAGVSPSVVDSTSPVPGNIEMTYTGPGTLPAPCTLADGEKRNRGQIKINTWHLPKRVQEEINSILPNLTYGESVRFRTMIEEHPYQPMQVEDVLKYKHIVRAISTNSQL